MFNYSTTGVTIELRDLLKMTDAQGKPFKLWDFDYPSYYKGEAKTAFEQKVIDHYMFRQIGVETPARFKHNFKTRIREIMPYYLQMYKSVEIMEKIEDPFGNVDVTETYTESHSGTVTGSHSSESSGTETGTTTSNSDVTSSRSESFEGSENRSVTENKLNKYSNTPQGEVYNIDSYMTDVRVEENATLDNLSRTQDLTEEASETTDTEGTLNTSKEASTSGQTSSSSEGTVTHTLTRQGNQGVNTYAHDMIEYRQSFIDVDMMIIRELSDLFLLVY